MLGLALAGETQHALNPDEKSALAIRCDALIMVHSNNKYLIQTIRKSEWRLWTSTVKFHLSDRGFPVHASPLPLA